MTRTITSLTVSALTIAALTACGTPSGDDYSDVLPDDRLLINLPVEFGGMERSAVGDASEYYQLTADTTGDVNTLISDVLRGVGYITDFDPTWSDDELDVALWGPWEDDGVNGRLWIEKHDDGHYTWAVDAKFVDESDDAYVPVFAGNIEPGADADNQRGNFAIDFNQLSIFDDSEDVTGEFYVEYTVDDTTTEATAAFVGFSSEFSEEIEAAYHYTQSHEGGGEMDLALAADATGNATPELMVIRSRWTDVGEGRADVYLTEGDLGPLVYTATECWGGDHTVVYYEDNYELVSNGDLESCAFGESSFNDSDDAPAAR